MDRTLSLLVKFGALDRLTAPLRQMTGGAKRAGKELADTRREVLGLERNAAKVAGLRTLQQQLQGTYEKSDEARRKVRNLELAIQHATGPTGQLTRQLDAARRKVERLGGDAEKQGARVAQLGGELRDAGVDVHRLGTEEERLARAIATANTRLGEQQRRSERAAASADRLRRAGEMGGRMRSRGAGMVAAGVAVAAPMGLAAREAISYESALANVRKVVSATPAEFAALDRGILDMSRHLPMAANDIASIVTAFAQSGVARDQLLGFTSDAVKMGIAFDMTAEEAGTTMAAWKSAFGMGRAEVRALADRVNYLGNTAGASSAKITEIVTRIGPLGAVGGLASGQIAALGATMASMGIESEIAATGIKNTMLALTKGTAATKEQKAAFKALGLDARKVASDMQRDAAGTIMRVMGLIGKLPKEGQAGLMTQLFGSESIAAIAPLLTQLPTLATNFQRVGDATRYAGSMDQEYAGQANTTANRLQLMNNRVDALKIKLGNQLLPQIEKVTDKIGKLADRISAWSDRNPEAAKGLAMLGAALGVLLPVLGIIQIAMSFVVRPLVMIFGWLRKLAPVMRIASSGVSWLARGILMVATAIGAIVGLPAWAVIAIGAAIAAAGYLVYRYWDQIKAAFGAAWTWITGFASRMGAAGMRVMVGLWNGIKTAFWTGVAWFRSIGGSMATIGAQLVQGIINGVGSMFGALKNKIIGLGKGAIGWFKGVLGIHSPSRVFADLGGHMMGGLALGLDRAAERPMQRVRAVGRDLARAAAIPLVAGASPAMAAAAPGGGAATAAAATVVHHHTYHITVQGGADPRGQAQRLMAELRRLQGEQDRASYQDRD